LPYAKHTACLEIRLAGAADGSAKAADFTYRLQEMQGMRSALKDVAPVTGGIEAVSWSGQKSRWGAH